MAEKTTARFKFPGPSETGEVKVGWEDFEELINRLEVVLYPAGDLRFTAKATLDEGWLKCEGQEVSRTTYKALFEAIGTSHGEGNKSTTFNLPDYRERTPVGSSAGLVNGAKGGEATHTLVTGEIPSHTHAVNLAGGGASVSGTLYGSFSGGISGVAADHLHQHPPYGDAGGYIGWKTQDLAGKMFGAKIGTPDRTNSQCGGLPEFSGVWDKTGASDRTIGVSGSCSGGCNASGTLNGGTSGTVTSNSTGSSAAHNNREPYTVCNVWIRT